MCHSCLWYKEEMTRAQVMILHGHQLAAGHHYATPLIVQHCNELRHHCDTLNSAISAKCKTLIQMQTLLQHLEEVRLTHSRLASIILRNLLNQSIICSYSRYIIRTMCLYVLCAGPEVV